MRQNGFFMANQGLGMRKSITLLTFLFCLACTRSDITLIHDPFLRQAVRQQLPVQKALSQNRQQALWGVLDHSLNHQEREAMEWLYAWMPLSDLADYSGDFYLRQVRSTLQARQEMPWGAGIPEAVFLHFVLPLRVNNEMLDSSRVAFYRMLKPRLRGLTMHQASLEVNHWCHEQVTYRGSDSRTSSPLATLVSAIGRCGEESVFTVSALRAVGIPARQVYVPRWAHTDDNHAWVEVWVDGTWHFLGACEPDADLDMGWFKEPARRAMLVHTRVIGPYQGPEEPLASSPRHREINLLARYATSKILTVKTVTRDGRPLADVQVSFRLYNYAEFYPLARRSTDNDGLCRLQTGLGDLLIWACKGEWMGYVRARTAAEDTVVVVLQPFKHLDEIIDLDFSPPIILPTLPDTVTAAAQENNKRRLAYEDSLRRAYEATFADSSAGKRLAQTTGWPFDSLYAFLKMSRGNHMAICDFLVQARPRHQSLALPMLRVLSEKDLRDARSQVLLDHLERTADLATAFTDRALYDHFLLNPRIGNELLSPWRKTLQENFSATFRDSVRQNPDLAVTWVKKNIRLASEANFYRVPLTPEGVWQLRVADELSRDIFLVALERSFGIPARLDPAFEKPQYLDSSLQEWQNVSWDENTAARDSSSLTAQNATLILQHRDPQITQPEYWTHFTLARFDKGEYHTLELDGLTLAQASTRLELPAGDYLLITGNRQNDGTVLTRLHFFTLPAQQEKRVPVEWRHATAGLPSPGRLPAEAKVKNRINESLLDLNKLASAKGLVLAWLDLGHEPSQHILREWQELRSLYEAWAGGMVAIITADQVDRMNEYQLPKQLLITVDEENRLRRRVEDELQSAKLTIDPLLILIGRDGDILLLNQGYQVGLGQRLLQTIRLVEWH